MFNNTCFRCNITSRCTPLTRFSDSDNRFRLFNSLTTWFISPCVIGKYIFEKLHHQRWRPRVGVLEVQGPQPPLPLITIIQYRADSVDYEVHTESGSFIWALKHIKKFQLGGGGVWFKIIFSTLTVHEFWVLSIRVKTLYSISYTRSIQTYLTYGSSICLQNFSDSQII